MLEKRPGRCERHRGRELRERPTANTATARARCLGFLVDCGTTTTIVLGRREMMFASGGWDGVRAEGAVSRDESWGYEEC